MRRVAIVGRGRAGGSLAAALGATGRWDVALLGRDDAPPAGVELVVLATPDAAVADVAVALPPDAARVVAHLSGALGPGPLADHPRWAIVHPLVSMPNPTIGAARLSAGAWFGVGGDPIAREVVDDLGGHAVDVADGDWVRYHAAAVIASNHLVGLLGQVERVAPVPLTAYLDLARGSLDNAAALGPAAALTGPVARGDWATVDAHLAALPADERAAYEAGVDLCRRLLA
jgi:predicted short-subunit dehydrogenase-like oxidoreductase (DUF2520 family)